MMAPAGAAVSAPALVRKRRASSVAWGGSTKNDPVAGGNGPAPLPTGWPTVDPSASRLAPVQTIGGKISRQPQPLGSGSKLAAHGFDDTLRQPATPICIISPAGHSESTAGSHADPSASR